MTLKEVEKPSNVIHFPKDKIVREAPVDCDEVIEMKSKGLKNYADAVVDEIGGDILDGLVGCGVEIDIEDPPKDYCFLIEILEASVYRTLGLDHKLHAFIDKHMIDLTIEKQPSSNVVVS